MNDIIKQFDILCDVAMAAFSEELEISYEMSLLNILEFVKKHPDYRERFIDRFKLILTSRNSPFEAVAFCMRELQWPEIKEFVISKMNPSEDPRSEALRSILTTYDEFWPDSDLYSYYSMS
ncbi:hypothetical protein HX893_02460 [Pseudomonas reactans]|uniref:Immunity protein 30 domain-containing protein n=1 Tax=Pseudomonas reactans TaxID=117680 RepID=A0A7Y8FYC6_9PSED|nr:hypothetical protein [Pseudomonas reactans]NWE86991.1 hypothetical protein [Pseudomonas reactans]